MCIRGIFDVYVQVFGFSGYGAGVFWVFGVYWMYICCFLGLSGYVAGVFGVFAVYLMWIHWFLVLMDILLVYFEYIFWFWVLVDIVLVYFVYLWDIYCLWTGGGGGCAHDIIGLEETGGGQDTAVSFTDGGAAAVKK